MDRRKMFGAAAGVVGSGLLTRSILADDTCESCGSECGDCRNSCLACVTACLEEMNADGKDLQECIRLCLSLIHI